MTPIALITDFGIADWYAGEMKGAMLSACPGITIIAKGNNLLREVVKKPLAMGADAVMVNSLV